MRSSMTVAQNVIDMFDGRLPVSHVVNPEVLSKRVLEVQRHPGA